MINFIYFFYEIKNNLIINIIIFYITHNLNILENRLPNKV
jgi:hypothetical protein